MSPETRWDRADRILEAALELPAEQQAPHIAEACAGDDELHALVARLLQVCGDRTDGLVSGGALAGELARELGHELAGRQGSLVGRSIGRYRLLRDLGQGGMATVYLAERIDDGVRQQVALKLLHPGLASANSMSRFHRERQILALANHPNIARLLDAGVSDEGLPYIVMEYIEGEAIDSYCDSRQLTVRQRLQLFCEVARAVSYAHRNLVVHRDIKPDNILVTAEGDVKLLDFGIAKLLDDEAVQATRTHLRAMTPAFASPEQIEGGMTTTACDVYQLGVLLYTLVTGSWPYHRSGHSDAAVLLAICREAAERPSLVVGTRASPTAVPGGRPSSVTEIAAARGSVPRRLRRELAGDLDTIILTALRKEPERRYGSVAELAGDIERYLAGRTISARPDTLAYRLRTLVRRHAVASLTAAISVLLIVFLVAFHLVQVGRERDRARKEADKATAVAEFLTSLFRVSAPTQSMGEQITTRELLDRGAARIDNELLDQPELQADMMIIIGDVYRELALYSDARALLERAVEIRRRLPGEHSLDLARSLNALGGVLIKTQESGPARQHLEEALALREAALGRDHQDVARTRGLLGLIAFNEGDIEAACTLHREEVRVLEATLGPAHQDVGLALVRLAVDLQKQGKHSEAIPLFERAITIFESTVGSEHPYMTGARFNLAGSLRYSGDKERAGRLYNEVLPMIERYAGADHPNVAIALISHANLLRDLGRYDEAEEELLRALAIWTAALGPDCPQNGWVLNNLGLVARSRGDHEAARDYFQRGVATTEHALGPDHADVATALRNLAQEMHATDEGRQAIPLLERAIAIRERAYGPDSFFVGGAAEELASVYLDLHDPVAAEPLLRRAVACGRRDPVHRTDEVTQPLVLLARCLAAQGRSAEALAVLAEERRECNEEGHELIDAESAAISVAPS